MCEKSQSQANAAVFIQKKPFLKAYANKSQPHILGNFISMNAKNVKITSADKLPALIDEVRGHFVISHELLETQEVQTACAQAGQK